jgi:hypothetical protein
MSLQEMLGAELYAQVVEKLGDKKIAIVSDGSYIPKAKFDERLEEIKTLKATVAERDTQLTTLQTAAAGNEALQKQIKDLQDANTASAAEWQQKLDKLTFEHTLDGALGKAKAKNPKAVKALLDMGKIKLDGETLLGLDDQLKALQKSDGYLFDVNQSGGGGNPPGDQGGTVNPYMKATYNLTEQMKLERTNPTLAAQMQAAAAGIK